jgi:phosphoribosylanthranilate isomerase
MKINKLTITGPDDNTDPLDLVRLSNEYPFVEWGILFSGSKVGQQRYPTLNWVDNLVHGFSDVSLSAHFCGQYAKDVLNNKNYSAIGWLPKRFKRVQLNYNFARSSGYDLQHLVEFVKYFSNKSIILQYNKSNAERLDRLLLDELPDTINFLYDSSGGNGKVIESIGSNIKDHYTGYSGGLSPDNIEEICGKVVAVPEDYNVWLDLETGVRTNNEFDLNKVEQVLKIVSQFI